MPDIDRDGQTSSSDWAFPVVGIVLSLLLAYGVGFVTGRDGHRAEQEHFPRYRYTQSNSPKAGQGAVEAFGPKIYREPCRDLRGSEESDLCAQWRAARAAEAAAVWTERGFWIGLASVIGLGVTIFLTLRATKAALRSAGAAERAIEMEGRPHILVEKMEMESLLEVPNGWLPRLKFIYQNHGSGPAWMTGHANYLVAYEQTPDEFPVVNPSVTNWPIAPNTGWGKSDFDETRQEHDGIDLDRVRNGSLTLFIGGMVRYVDAAQRTHEHRYVYTYHLGRQRLEPLNHNFWTYS